MKLIYQVDDKVKFGPLVVFAIQQLLAIMTATLVVPIIINGNVLKMIAEGTSLFGSSEYVPMSPAAALFGAGVGTLIYVLLSSFGLGLGKFLTRSGYRRITVSAQNIFGNHRDGSVIRRIRDE